MIERFRNVRLPEPESSLTDGFVAIIRRRPDLAFREVTPQVTHQVAPQVTSKSPSSV
jgi:hypothetical protein